jgi:hypothetical protein
VSEHSKLRLISVGTVLCIQEKGPIHVHLKIANGALHDMVILKCIFVLTLGRDLMSVSAARLLCKPVHLLGIVAYIEISMLLLFALSVAHQWMLNIWVFDHHHQCRDLDHHWEIMGGAQNLSATSERA